MTDGPRGKDFRVPGKIGGVKVPDAVRRNVSFYNDDDWVEVRLPYKFYSKENLREAMFGTYMPEHLSRELVRGAEPESFDIYKSPAFAVSERQAPPDKGPESDEEDEPQTVRVRTKIKENIVASMRLLESATETGGILLSVRFHPSENKYMVPFLDKLVGEG